LRGGDPSTRSQTVELPALLRSLVTEAARREPAPTLAVAPSARGRVCADPDRLASVIDNVIRNAQEATGRSGSVQIRMSEDAGAAVIEIEDDGVGMDADFIRDRLFRPFDSTKGLAGMGIGAYDCREYLNSLGGAVEVTSRPGQGTCFRIRMPLVTAPT
jgi:signal transduction histidine kinase